MLENVLSLFESSQIPLKRINIHKFTKQQSNKLNTDHTFVLTRARL